MYLTCFNANDTMSTNKEEEQLYKLPPDEKLRRAREILGSGKHDLGRITDLKALIKEVSEPLDPHIEDTDSITLDNTNN